MDIVREMKDSVKDKQATLPDFPSLHCVRERFPFNMVNIDILFFGIFCVFYFNLVVSFVCDVLT